MPEEMMNHRHNHQENAESFLLQMTTKVKRISRNDTLQWEPMWGPPL